MTNEAIRKFRVDWIFSEFEIIVQLQIIM